MENRQKYSYWDPSTVGLTSGSWSSFPKAAAEDLVPSQLELGNTEVIINFPSFISHPADIKRHVRSGGAPPPPPTYPESSWDQSAHASYATSSHPPAPTGAHQLVPFQSSRSGWPPIDLLGAYTSEEEA